MIRLLLIFAGLLATVGIGMSALRPSEPLHIPSDTPEVVGFPAPVMPDVASEVAPVVLPPPAVQPKLTDYKFWYIKRNDSGVITEAAVRYYEGAIITANERDFTTNTLVPVTRYRRTGKLDVIDLKAIDPQRNLKSIKKDTTGVAVVYAPADFGVISTDDQLRAFLNGELKKDKTRTPVAEQI